MKKKILFVDDEVSATKLVRSVLAEVDCEIDAVQSPARALVKCREVPYHLVIADIVMPGMSGIQMITLMRESGFRKPVIFLSGTTDPAAKASSQTIHNAYFLDKGTELTQLSALVRQLL